MMHGRKNIILFSDVSLYRIINAN